MSTLKFPRTLAAAERAQRDTWALADAVLAECGAPVNGQQPDPRIAACAAELARNGYDYDEQTLRNYRTVAATFPPAGRSGYAVGICKDAGTPEMLAALEQMAARKRVKLTRKLVREWVPVIRDAQEQEQERERAKAEAKAEAKLRKAKVERETATTDADRRRADRLAQEAEREQREAAKMPTPDPTAVKAETVNTLLWSSQIGALGAQAQRAAAEALATLEKAFGYFTEEELQEVREAAQAAMNDWGKVVGYRRERTQRRPAII